MVTQEKKIRTLFTRISARPHTNDKKEIAGSPSNNVDPQISLKPLPRKEYVIPLCV